MSLPRMKIKTPVPFPANVAGMGGIKVTKANGVWTIEPDFSALSAVLASAIADPTTKEIWLWDPVTGDYNVLTLAGLGDALFKLTSPTSLAIGTGSKVFATQSGKDIGPGSWVLATSDSVPSNYMLGQVTAYSGTSLTINAVAVGGGGTYGDWTIRPSGTLGPQGNTGAGYGGTSSTSAAIVTGSKTFATQSGLAYLAGNRVRVSSNANGTNYMEGLVTSYGGTSMVVSVDKVGGSGTCADWNIGIAGQPGSGDLLSSNNLSDIAARYAGFDNLSVRGADIASAATINLDGATGNLVDVTGTATIAAITLADGRERTVRFTGALTLTNSASLVMPGGSNITTSAGDYALFRGYASGVVRCASYTRAAGRPLTTGNPETISKGFTISPYNVGTLGATWTPDPTQGNYQYATAGATACTMSPPASDCAIDILISNASAGGITMSGFTAPTGGGGDTYNTTGTNKFILMIRRINSVSTYTWKALQ